jgi:acetyl-CoA C-acetyltransferase
MSVQVVATGIGRFGRRNEDLVELLAEAGNEALEGIGRKPVDFLAVGAMAPSVFGGVENLTARLADRLGLDGSAGYRIEAASASGAAVVHAAAAAVAAGTADRALVVAGEKMTGRPNEEVAATLAHSLAPAEVAVGATMPALAAIVAQRYLEQYGVSPDAFDRVTVAARRQSALNPHAQFPTPVTAEEVAASRPIALPLRLLHCSAVSDGAAALVLERGSGPAEILGLGQGFDSLMVADRPDVTSFRATRTAAKRAYEQSHLTRKHVQVAEVHDAFAPFALIDLEDLGLCGPGEAGGWFLADATGPTGRLPVNLSGGLLGRGHPVGASGLVQVAEIARQLRGEAGAMQLDPRPRVGVAQSIGGLASHNFVTLLGTEGMA